MSKLTQDIKDIKRLNQRADDYLRGFKYGKTMAEVDAYYEGLLKELKDLEKLLKEGDDNGQTSREEINEGR